MDHLSRLSRSLALVTSLILLVCVQLARGQGASSAILGVVTDPSGAVVPGAKVSATQLLTNQTYDTITTAEGYYRFAALPVGPYRVDVEASGFAKASSRLQQPLQVDDRVRLDFGLTPGTVSEAVTVTAQAQSVDTTQSAVRYVVDNRRMTDLPLNGRNMINLLLLTPGATGAPGGGGVQSPQTGYSVNGGRGSTINFLLDGGDNNDYFTNTASYFPNPDAVQEFSVQANSFSAEHGRAAGGIVNVVTKSGTNEWHGSVFEFLRNDALNTRNFFSISKPRLRQNQFGGTLGGPLVLPRLYNGTNRTFFFVSYQATRTRYTPTISSTIVPTPAERSGDYSDSPARPTDPATNQPFPNARIPASRIDPIAQKFLEQYVPLPNLGGGQFSINANLATDADEGVIRLDHSLSDYHKVYGRSFTQAVRSTDPDRLPAFRNRQEFHAWNLSAGDTLIIRPTVVNLFTITMNRTATLPGPDNRFRWRDQGVRIPLVGAESDPTNSTLNVTGAFGFSQRVALRLPRTVFHLTESISVSRGSHFLRIGFEGRHVQEVRRTNNNVDGAFTFNGQFSRVPVADFQLGLPNNFIQFANFQEGLPRNVGVGWYVQDDWKVNRRLTLNIGLRLDPFFPVVDQRDRRPVFRPGQQSTVFPTAPLGMVYPGDAGVARGAVTNQWNKWAPRFGLAWDVFGNGRTSLRAGYGIFYDYPSTTHNNGFNSQPYSYNYNIVGPQSFANPYGSIQPVIPYVPPQTPEERARFRYILPTPILGLDADFTSGYSHQYNLSIEQALPVGFRASVAYVGAVGIHLPVVKQINPAVYRPGATAGNTDARRIYAPNFQDISTYSPAGTSSYHSLQTTINRRLASGFTLMGSYIFGKSMDICSDSRLATVSNPAQNPFDLRSERAPSDYDLKHSFVASWIWEMPFFRHSRGVTRLVLGGWQLSQIVALRSGAPFSVVTGRDNSFTGINKDRPNVVGDWSLPEGGSRGDLIQQYFNRAAFAPNATGTFGNAGRNILRAPGRRYADMALTKEFLITDRLRVQFRAEAFNAFNFVNLGGPGNSLNTAVYGRIVSAEDGRIFQLALKMRW